jgi:hypothetical protein
MSEGDYRRLSFCAETSLVAIVDDLHFNAEGVGEFN